MTHHKQDEGALHTCEVKGCLNAGLIKLWSFRICTMHGVGLNAWVRREHGGTDLAASDSVAATKPVKSAQEAPQANDKELRESLRQIVTRNGKSHRIPELLEQELDDLVALIHKDRREAELKGRMNECHYVRKYLHFDANQPSHVAYSSKRLYDLEDRLKLASHQKEKE